MFHNEFYLLRHVVLRLPVYLTTARMSRRPQSSADHSIKTVNIYYFILCHSEKKRKKPGNLTKAVQFNLTSVGKNDFI